MKLVRRLVLAASLVALSSQAIAQERTFTVTLPESQWNNVARIVSKAKGEWTWEEINPILSGIGAQIRAQIDQQELAKKKAAEEIGAMRQEIERLKAQIKSQPEAPQ